MESLPLQFMCFSTSLGLFHNASLSWETFVVDIFFVFGIRFMHLLSSFFCCSSTHSVSPFSCSSGNEKTTIEKHKMAKKLQCKHLGTKTIGLSKEMTLFTMMPIHSRHGEKPGRWRGYLFNLWAFLHALDYFIMLRIIEKRLTRVKFEFSLRSLVQLF